ncbi:MAG: class D sortase [Anaerolineae bacterium]|nr:class D sortase [Anaerolineae bacterium]
MFGNRNPQDLSVDELEKLLLVKRRQSRLERFQRLSDDGRTAHEALVETSVPLSRTGLRQSSLNPAHGAVFAPGILAPAAKSVKAGQDDSKKTKRLGQPPKVKSRSRKIMDALLLSLEVAALAGLVGVLVASYFNLKELNDEVSLAQQNVLEQQAAPAPTSAPPIAVARLPGGHSPPTSPGGAVPDVPPHLQHWVQPESQSSSALSVAGAIEVAPPNSTPATRIVIPKIKVNAPVVGGVGWEDLKKGVGHLPGSANPGERGNMYLAAHNDIYGEIFRYLEKLEVGDEYFIFAGEEEFRYVVQEKRVIEPTEVDVMLPSTEPVATLQTCYPYLVDTHRLIVIGELAE